jgi:hypothetical protein
MCDELLDECERWYRAWFEKDAATVQRLMAEDYLYVGPSGFVLDRQGILAVIRSPSYRLDAGTRTEIVARPLGQSESRRDSATCEAALVRHRWQGSGSYEGASFTEDNRCVMAWEKRDGQWRLVMDQCSHAGG